MTKQIHQVKGWTVELELGENGLENYRIYNRGPDLGFQFYMITQGVYGQPLVIQEPSLGIDCPSNLVYFSHNGDPVVPDQKIVGIVCRNGPRFSLTNAKMKGIEVSVSDDTNLMINGEVWHVNTLYMPDKNRLIGYVAFCSKESKPSVYLLEMGDLDLF